MVRERNQFITSMKSEIYRKEYRNDTERVDMRTQMIQKEKKIAALEVCGRVLRGWRMSSSPSHLDRVGTAEGGDGGEGERESSAHRGCLAAAGC